MKYAFLSLFLVLSSCRTTDKPLNSRGCSVHKVLYSGFDHHIKAFQPFLYSDGDLSIERFNNPELKKKLEAIIQKEGHIWIKNWYQLLLESRKRDSFHHKDMTPEKLFLLETLSQLPFSPSSIKMIVCDSKKYDMNNTLKDSAWYVAALRERVKKELDLTQGGVFSEFSQNQFFKALKEWSSSTEEVRVSICSGPKS